MTTQRKDEMQHLFEKGVRDYCEKAPYDADKQLRKKPNGEYAEKSIYAAYEGFKDGYRAASSPPVPDDVAEAVKVLNLLDGHDLWVETLEYPEDGREGYRSTCPVRKEAFKAAKETLIRAASTPSAEVRALRGALEELINFPYEHVRKKAQGILDQPHTGGK